MATRFRVEVIADDSGQWCGNSISFSTHEQAEKYAKELAMRWILVRDWRVVEIPDNVPDEQKDPDTGL
jgi:hypothetical protein